LLLTTNPKVDPIGACVGVKGSRVRPIINELQGERIDLVAYSEDPATYIAASLAPAKPVAVIITDEKNKKAEALVTDDALSLAIGKNGQNVRLACKLTGWDISIKTESQRKQESQQNIAHVRDMLLQLEGVGPKIADVLVKGGMDSIEKIKASKMEDLTVFSGIGEKLAEKIVHSAQSYVPPPPPVVEAAVEASAPSATEAPTEDANVAAEAEGK
jgi:N utilization substance protein A